MTLRRRGRGTTVLVAVVLVTGLAIAAAGTDALLGQAQRHYHVADTAADLERDLTRLDSLNDDLSDTSTPSPDTVAHAISSERHVTADSNALEHSGEHTAAIDALVTHARDLVAGVARERTLIGHPKEIAAQAARNETLFVDLQAQVTPVVALSRTHADNDARAVKVRLLGLCLAVLAALVWLVWWDGRRRRGEDRVRLARTTSARFEALVEHGSDVVMITDLAGTTSYISSSLSHLLGRPPADWQGRSLPSLLHPDDVESAADALGQIQLDGELAGIDLRVLHANGEWRILEMSAIDMRSSAEVRGVVWHGRDVTDRRNLEATLVRQTFEDGLTGMANRALFTDRLNQAQARASRAHRPLAVLLLGLDSFKSVNDTLGQGAGDGVLVTVGARLAACIRPGDTVARFGGDEFTILIEDMAAGPIAEELAARILDATRRPMTIRGSEIRLTCSVGVAVSAAGVESAEELVRNADVAMYVAKAQGRDRVARFEPAMRERARDRLTLSADLSGALDRNEFALHYQPIVTLATGDVQGAEALVRWHHPQRGTVTPLSFIPLAEQSGEIVPIGRWILEQACEQAAEWCDLPGLSGFSISVNVSGRQLLDDSLVSDVKAILAKAGLRPSGLTLEITESVLMADIDGVIARLDQLKVLGVRLAIDDFGTGYSSLAYLNHFPIDVLKIDKSFVDAAAVGTPGAETLVHTIVSLARSLGLKTVAEGIEQPAQETQMRNFGCDAGQGYLWARPMRPEEFTRMLAAHHGFQTVNVG